MMPRIIQSYPMEEINVETIETSSRVNSSECCQDYSSCQHRKQLVALGHVKRKLTV